MESESTPSQETLEEDGHGQGGWQTPRDVGNVLDFDGAKPESYGITTTTS